MTDARSSSLPLPDRLGSASGLLRIVGPALPFLVLVAAVLAHAPVLQGDWVLDDAVVVRDNPVVMDGVAGLADAFASTAWKGDVEPGVWRPVTLISFAVESPLWRTEAGRLTPFVFRLTNLLLHGLCAVLLFLLLSRLLPRRPWLVLGGALVFGVHPMHAGTVAAVVGRADLLALLFSLLAALLWIRDRPAWLPLAALCYLLAILSKETAIALPVALLLLDAATPGGLASSFRRRAPGWILVGLTLVLFFVLWPGPFATFPPSLPLVLAGFGRAVLALFLPLGFVRDRLALTNGLVDMDVPWGALALGLAVALLAVVGVLRRGRSRGVVVATGVLSALFLWLGGALVSTPAAWLEVRFAYVTTPGLFVVAGALLEALVTAPPLVLRTAGRAGALVLLVLLAALCWRESGIWHDDESYHLVLRERYADRDALLVRSSRRLRLDAEAERRWWATQPMTEERRRDLSARTGRALIEAEALAYAATKRADVTRRDDPAAAHAWRELGFVQLARSHTADAAHSLLEALRLDPWLSGGEKTKAMSAAHRRLLVKTYVRLAAAEQSLGEAREAAAHLEAAVTLLPRDLEVLRAAGGALVRAGDYARGLTLLKRALDTEPDPATGVWIEREIADARRAARDAAERAFRAARVSEERTDYREAAAAYEEALGLDPTLWMAWWSLANLRGTYFGDYLRAHTLLDDAERLLGETGGSAVGDWGRKFRDLRARLRRQEREDEEAERDGDD